MSTFVFVVVMIAVLAIEARYLVIYKTFTAIVLVVLMPVFWVINLIFPDDK